MTRIPEDLVGPGRARIFETDLFRPVYRPMQGTRWALQVVPMILSRG